MSQFLTKDKESVDVGAADKIYSADLSTDRTVLDIGETARVYGINVVNSSGTPAEVTFTDGSSNLKFIHTIGSKTTAPLVAGFDTSGGLVAEGLTGTQANKVFINVFYSTNFLA